MKKADIYYRGTLAGTLKEVDDGYEFAYTTEYYSLYSPDNQNFQLTPAYDLLSTKLVMPEDTEELALTICGKKKKLRREHFIKSMADSGLLPKVIEHIFVKYEKTFPKMQELITQSFLPPEMQSSFIDIIGNNLKTLIRKG